MDFKALGNDCGQKLTAMGVRSRRQKLARVGESTHGLGRGICLTIPGSSLQPAMAKPKRLSPSEAVGQAAWDLINEPFTFGRPAVGGSFSATELGNLMEAAVQEATGELRAIVYADMKAKGLEVPADPKPRYGFWTCEEAKPSGGQCPTVVATDRYEQNRPHWYRDDGLIVCARHALNSNGRGSWNEPSKAFHKKRAGAIVALRKKNFRPAGEP